MSGGGDQSTAAREALTQDMSASERTMGIAMPLLKELIGYSKGQIAAGEPGYVKEGFASFNEGLREKARASSAADLSAEFTSQPAPQGGRALSEIGRLSAGGAGKESQAVSASNLEEGKTMYMHTQALLDAMSGNAGSAIGSSVTAANQRIEAIAGMRQFNPTTSSILGVLNAGSSIYGAFNQAGYMGSTNGMPNSMGPGGFGYTESAPINVSTGGG